MAKFCENCGKLLFDGEQCDCLNNDANRKETKDTILNLGTLSEQGEEREQDVETITSEVRQEISKEIEKMVGDTNLSDERTKQGANASYQNNVFQRDKDFEKEINMEKFGYSQNEEQQESEKESDFKRKANSFYSGAKKGLSNLCNNVWTKLKQLKQLKQYILPIMKSPVKEISYLMKNKENVGLHMILLHIIVASLSLMVIVESGYNFMFSRFYYLFGYSALELGFGVAIFVAVTDFLLSGLLLFVSKVVYNCDTTYKKMMTLVGGMSIINSTTLAAGAVIGLFLSGLCTVVIGLGMIMSILALVLTYSENVRMDADQKVYALLITAALYVVAVVNIYIFIF